MSMAIGLAIWASSFSWVWGEAADYVYVAPEVTEKAGEVMSNAVVDGYLRRPAPMHVFSEFAGKNQILAAEEAGKTPCPLAQGFAVDLDSATLFDAGVVDRGERECTASIVSEGALAMRLLVELETLGEGDRLWLLEPQSRRALGPYTSADAIEGGRWLPTVWGDTVVLLLQSGDTVLPGIHVVGGAHFYRLPTPEKVLDPDAGCPTPVACESDTSFQQVSTGIGMLIIPTGSFSQVQCSGALLNNPDTEAYEPYLLTAYHCVDEASDIRQMDVVWDYRAPDCAEHTAPGTVLHSSGDEILATNDWVDGALLSLKDVPVGIYGRAWLGWDTNTLVEAEPVMSAHHPEGAWMKLAAGQITATGLRVAMGLRSVFYQNQVQWQQGITKGGSSGSPLLKQNEAYRVVGMLSNGPTHDCSNPSQNIDNFASFRDFYPQISCYLKVDSPCGEHPNPPDDSLCPLKALYGAHSQTTEELRLFRDRVLAKTDLGRQVIKVYYTHSLAWTKQVESSAVAALVVRSIATPCAQIGAWMSEAKAVRP